MKTRASFLILITILVSCGCMNDIDAPDQELISEIEGEGYDYIAQCDPPNGIADTLAIGYTNRVDGVYHNKSQRFEGLTIKGYEFEEVSHQRYKSKLMVYTFAFADPAEEKKFVDFQAYILNYQRHTKNKVEFYQRDEIWCLRFQPMP